MYPVNERKIGDNSCPYCNHTKLKSGVNDLTITNPQLASEFSPRNDKKANEVGEWQKYEVFWICPDCGAEYRYVISERSVGDDSCPVCTNKRVEKGINDLATTDPDIAALLSPNDERKADEILAGGSYVALWTCPECGGEYRRRVKYKEHGSIDCPYCHGTKVLTGYNDLATTNPELVPQYSSLNERPATMVRKDWHVTAYWECPDCHYVYERDLRAKANDNSDCPVCSKRIAVEGLNTLQDEYPNLPFIWSEKNEKKPTEVTSQSSYKAVWYCPTCKHEFKAEVRKVIDDEFECPICTGKTVVAGYNSLEDEYPEIAKRWAESNDRLPSEVLSSHIYRAEWVCPTCGGKYTASVRDVVNGLAECPYCNNEKPLAGFNTLLDLYPEIQDEWAENENTLLGIFPDEILPTSTARVWWECKDCGRKYLLSVNMWVEKHIRGMTSCTYCSGLRMRETHVLL